MKKTEIHMRGFRRALGQLVGEANFPPSVVGDLTELLFLFERGEKLLHRLRSHSGSRRRAALLVLRVEDFVCSDLSWTVRDLRPSLRRLTKLAYSEPKRAREKSGTSRRAARR